MRPDLGGEVSGDDRGEPLVTESNGPLTCIGRTPQGGFGAYGILLPVLMAAGGSASERPGQGGAERRRRRP
jgi:hypothetical protein